ncbi:glucose-6-phosphate dehydrogenase assembly protein OpcA [Janibacter anophelis]|uniref:glucose-6-phosphate dehydrogenase assembly protein OpcA n=1 Tax=Janibacter anophelis TaxID=319054 RepID=UPI000DEF64E9|nr:glucose-6-phosphate dehydrogenase assembly protein OpcA [Janibacter anophelis]
MIVDLPSASTSLVSQRLIEIREDVGAMALSRVLTLVVVVPEDDAEDALAVANSASHQHPARIICVILANARGKARLDAQIRVGGDAGASEVVVLRLYGELTRHARSVVTPLVLPDSPVVAWWPTEAPKDPSQDPVGLMAQRRVTDCAAAENISATLRRLARTYAPGDTDLAWSRITLWRGLLATTLDRAPFEPVTSATVVGAEDSPSADLLAGWLRHRLRCPVSLVRSRTGSGLVSVRLERRSGPIDLVRPLADDTATLDQAGQPRRAIALAPRSDAECLADELRRLDPDEVYEDALTRGLPDVTRRRMTMSDAVEDGLVPSPSEARREGERLAEQSKKALRSAMVEAAPEEASSRETDVKTAVRDRLDTEDSES